MAHACPVVITKELGDVSVPKSYRAALTCEHAAYWREAIAKELGGLLRLHTWDLVPASTMPPGSNLMHCHYVFDVKRTSTGTIEKFKARLVADGNTQKHGVDFDRIFSTVVKTQTLRLVLAIAALHDYNLTSIDIRQAYLQAELKEDLFMRPPPGVPSVAADGRPLVCKLRRTLYGLKQAGREWAAIFTEFLLLWGMTRSVIDVCLYTFTDAAGHCLIICVYVDDALLCDNHPPLRRRFVADLERRFPTEDKGELRWILNVAIARDRAARTLTLSQSLYVTDLLSKFAHLIDPSMTRHFDSPMEEGLDLSPADSPAPDTPEAEEMAFKRDEYMSIVGGILWLANMTRPDIAYAASQLARYLANPGPTHLRAAVRVLIYLRDAPDRSFTYAPDATSGLVCYVDSNWSTGYSTSGAFLFFYGCVIHWFSKMQRSVALSSAEAEFFGAMLAAKEVIFLRELLVDLGFPPSGPTPMRSDSKSAVDMSFDPVAFKKTKHILRSASFLRDLVAHRVVVLSHVSGKRMVADILTKACSRAIFLELIRMFDAPLGFLTADDA